MSPGPDGLHPRVIKEMMEELLQPLRILFESSFQEGNIPEDWHIAYITAIYKKGSKSEPGNYRSTVLQLIRVLDGWTEIIDDRQAVDIVYCDFMKAFDRVPHKRLLEKSI
ncbi:uncharacterized protein LOC121869880 [Homarus americanus]|uniref:uncharacterized protein LOC121869880 n=1 Tax=Homarus americanus TaxID=6706 RepID=UPI001C47A50E|nr:uncharacterized protein LOC121869880 [Homarus americanus]